MQKFVNFNIDTTIDNSIELEKRINKGDTIKFTIKVFNNGVLTDLTNDIVNLVLLKADGTVLEDVTTTKSNGVVTFDLSQQATLSEGNTTGTLQITESSTSHLSTNIFTYFVNPSITDSVLEASQTEIKSLGEVMAIIKNNTEIVNDYVDDITQIAGTAESVQALANIKVYVDTNLPSLISENNEAITNIANENIQNDEATQNIIDLTPLNNTASTLKSGLEADISSGGTLKTGLESTISTGAILKSGLEADISSGGTLKTGLELAITNGTTLKGEIIAENIIAEANIEAMQSFGDITALSQTVTDIKTEVETARGASANLDSRLDLVDTSLSDLTNNKVNNSEVVTTPTANKILKLNSSSKLPASITGDADSVDGIQGNQIPLKTLSDITYYVNASTGLDTNNGLTIGTPFKTIAKAISLISQIVDHVITINLASGTYTEDVILKGLMGNGSIILNGATTLANASNYVVSSFVALNCTCNITVQGIGAYSTNYHGFTSGSCSNTSFINCLCGSVTTSYAGFCGYNGGYLYINGCSPNNRASGIFASSGITILSDTNVDSTNTVGINCISATVIKKGTQPSGTTAEITSYGGVIR